MEDRGSLSSILNLLSSIHTVNGPLAQLVEQLTLNQRVRSSSLRRPTKSLLQYQHFTGWLQGKPLACVRSASVNPAQHRFDNIHQQAASVKLCLA
jgi:hypothetical protein